MAEKSILYKMEVSGNLIAISTVARNIGRKGRFLIVAEKLRGWYSGDRKTPFLDTDCGHYLMITDGAGGTLDVRFTWLNDVGGGRTEGYRQGFSIRKSDLRELLYMAEPPKIRRLYQPMRRQAKIIMDGRCHMSDNKLIRRAFSKAMRDSFQYGADETILLYPDYPHGYGFVNYAGEKVVMSGGLIAHFGNIRAANGRTYTKVTFSVHT